MKDRVVEARAADGQVVRGRLVGAAPRADVVLLPALVVPVGYYEPLLHAWAARGRTVLGVEYRGMPLSPRRPGAGVPGYSR